MQYLNGRDIDYRVEEGRYESAEILDTGIGYWMFFIADFVHDLSGTGEDGEAE